MQSERRLYRRESEESRRSALIAAAQSLVAEGGMEAATVRAIADRAGVTGGLIRHYFKSKDELIRAAYRALMDGMTAKGADATEGVGAGPEERLAAFCAATLRPPVMEASGVVLWAAFMHRIRADADLLALHEAGYLAFRTALEALIVALPRKVLPGQTRAEAIACNALLDGLWIEGALLPAAFAPAEIITVGLRSVGAILGVNLLNHTAKLPEFRKPVS